LQTPVYSIELRVAGSRNQPHLCDPLSRWFRRSSTSGGVRVMDYWRPLAWWCCERVIRATCGLLRCLGVAVIQRVWCNLYVALLNARVQSVQQGGNRIILARSSASAGVMERTEVARWAGWRKGEDGVDAPDLLCVPRAVVCWYGQGFKGSSWRICGCKLWWKWTTSLCLPWRMQA